MLDLDAIQARYDRGMFSSNPAIAFAAIKDVPALVAELRAARAVRDEIRRLYEDDRILLPEEDERLLRLLAAWDEHRGEAR